MHKPDILSMTPAEIETAIVALNQPLYRAKQVWGWLHQKHVQTFDHMANLPKALRDQLDAHYHIATVREVKKLTSKNDDTQKYLFALNDGALIESVLMEYNHGSTVCVSTQVGCRMGCTFCASAEGGLVRNLTAGEMCAQVYAAATDLSSGLGSGADTGRPLAQSQGRRVSGVVLMGCGEPLDNFDATLRFIELITHPDGLNIGQRHITLSTCGLVPQILKLAQHKLQITLAISLHGATDDVRQKLMPIAKRYPLSELMEACRVYVKTTNRRLTFEYALAKGVNDSPAHAKDLVRLLKGINCHVNLIPVNKARGSFSGTSRKEAAAFAAILQEARIQTTIRRSLGSDVDAACGQLRAKGLDA